MATFKVVGVDPGGKRVQQTLQAGSREEVLSQLRRDNVTVLSVSESRAVAKKDHVPWYKKSLGGPPKPKLKTQDLVVFTRQFTTMVSAGIPILECLEILTEQATDPGFKMAMDTIVDDVRAGSDLSEAMAKHPSVFENIYVNMIKAGEASGQLEEILQRLSEFLENSVKLMRQIKSAMTYPLVSLGMIFGITIFLMVFIIPKFQTIFKQMGMEDDLPIPTKVVLGVSHVMRNYAFQSILIFILVVFLFRWWKKTDSGNYIWDKVKLKLPVFGDLAQKVALSRFSRTFSTMIAAGVPILGALEIVGATSGNKVVEQAVEEARESIRAGNPLADPLGKSPVFPPMVVRMIKIGEKSGALEDLLSKIAEFYDDQVSATVESLTSLIEPLMIGLMGLMVGGIVLSVFLPIFKIQDKLTRG